MINKVTILVNTSDSFDDCWDPFFKLFYKYWPDCNIPILLNTEKKSYQFPGLNIISSQVNLKFNKRLTWSECLIEALKKIETPVVLYMQEDYFIENFVQVDIIKEFTDLMCQNEEIKYIGLTYFGNLPPFLDYPNDVRLVEVSKFSKYRVSTQAGLWKKDTLMNLLREKENGWMFEIFGTNRSKKRSDLFLTVNRDIFNKANSIIDYQLTGIIKGKWLSTIPELFKKENIDIDFSKRGFYKNRSIFFRKIETFSKIIKNPIILIKGMMGK
jgi:hypothetical protein